MSDTTNIEKPGIERWRPSGCVKFFVAIIFFHMAFLGMSNPTGIFLGVVTLILYLFEVMLYDPKAEEWS